MPAKSRVDSDCSNICFFISSSAPKIKYQLGSSFLSCSDEHECHKMNKKGKTLTKKQLINEWKCRWKQMRRPLKWLLLCWWWTTVTVSGCCYWSSVPGCLCWVEWKMSLWTRANTRCQPDNKSISGPTAAIDGDLEFRNDMRTNVFHFFCVVSKRDLDNLRLMF